MRETLAVSPEGKVDRSSGSCVRAPNNSSWPPSSHTRPIAPARTKRAGTRQQLRYKPPKNYFSGFRGNRIPEQRGSGDFSRRTTLQLVLCILHDIFPTVK